MDGKSARAEEISMAATSELPDKAVDGPSHG